MERKMSNLQDAIRIDTNECLPSKTTDAYWLGAECKADGCKEQTKRAGKWLVYISLDNVDEFWIKIKQATDEGRLGYCSKVSTARANPLASSKAKLIVVYTYDWTDKDDVMRIREELRKLGIVRKISYKTNEDTLAGKYKNTTSSRISKYYE